MHYRLHIAFCLAAAGLVSGNIACFGQQSSDSQPARGALFNEYTIKIPPPEAPKAVKTVPITIPLEPIRMPTKAPAGGVKKPDLQRLAAPAPSFSLPSLAIPKDKPEPAEGSGDATGNNPSILDQLVLKGRVVKNPEDRNHLSFGIVGLRWQQGAHPTVIEVFPDTPAAQAGILPFDELLAVDSHPLIGLPLDKVAGLIIDAPGTPVILSIQRLGQVQAAVMVRMDVDEIKDPVVREMYGRNLKKLANPEDDAELSF